MRAPTGATPLFALNGLALDLETTSLDVREARIVQIGALELTKGTLNESSAFDRIVDPGIPIPPRSTAIHGITNAMASEAADLLGHWPELTALLHNRVLIGHTIAYDLTVLEKEAARLDLEWRKPRSLCIRLLAPLALPDLANHSLDALASWFGITIKDRHSALSDADAAARVFLKMIPLLGDAGIRTLAEAERASLSRGQPLEEGKLAGWVRPVADPSEVALSGGFTNYDTYAYRHTVSDMMAKNPVIIAPSHTLQEAASVMAGKHISSVLVCDPPEAGRHASEYGILTERDVMRRIAADGAGALEATAGKLAISPIHAIRENAFIYRAFARMRRLKIRHLAVVDDERRLTGMISARDLLKMRTDPAIMLDDAIGEAADAADMASAWATLPAVVQSLISEGLGSHTITRIVSEEIRSMTERAAILSERQMEASGKGRPPCDYAVMVLGSGGRGESLLKPDQDNAIVFESGEPGSSQDQWFAELGAIMADILNEAGIPYCDGGIMAKNELWRGSVSTWQERVGNWVSRSRPQDVLNVDIWFDQIPVYGKLSLATGLFFESYAVASRNIGFAKALGAGLEATSTPFGFFGGIKAKNNKLDLKLHALFPLVSAARALAIRHNLAVHSTRARLELLGQLDKGDVKLIANLARDHALILSLMLKSQQREVATGRKPTNFIDLASLNRDEMADLKEALLRRQLLPELVRDLMF